MPENNSESMHNLPQNERPYEKMRLYGIRSLSDAELLAVILRSGSHGNNALKLGQRILKQDESGGLSFLAHSEPEELSQIDGIGPIKSAQICAAVELGLRVRRGQNRAGLELSDPESVWDFLRGEIAEKANEDFYGLYLDSKNRLIRRVLLSRGGMTSLVIQPGDILRHALRLNASGLILAHNHPSGDTSPSHEDRKSTEQIAKAAGLMGVRLLDHVIIGRQEFYSFRRSGLLSRQG